MFEFFKRRRKVRQVLKEIRQVIADHKWTKGTNAIDAHAEPTDYKSPDAVGFCLMGAALKATHGAEFRELFSEVREKIEKQIKKQAGLPAYGRYSSITWWNDVEAKSKEDVLCLLDKTIGWW